MKLVFPNEPSIELKDIYEVRNELWFRVCSDCINESDIDKCYNVKDEVYELLGTRCGAEFIFDDSQDSQ